MYRITYRILYIQGGAGFPLSTVPLTTQIHLLKLYSPGCLQARCFTFKWWHAMTAQQNSQLAEVSLKKTFAFMNYLLRIFLNTNLPFTDLVGGFNPIWKKYYIVNLDPFPPIFGMNINNNWNSTTQIFWVLQPTKGKTGQTPWCNGSREPPSKASRGFRSPLSVHQGHGTVVLIAGLVLSWATMTGRWHVF